jgi:hypothetical protein
MKKTSAYLLLAAGILLLAGCQKTGLSGTVSGDNTIRFAAIAAPGTKTAYSGEVTNNVERIDWVKDDLIRIYSDKAVYRYDDKQFYSDYKVSSATSNNEKSTAEVVPSTGNGLIWGDEPQAYTFWGVYPATDCPDGATGVLKLNIPYSQDGKADNVKTYGFLTAAATANITADDLDANKVVKTKKNGGTKDDVTLAFEPAFTAFEIELVSNELTMTVNSFTLSSDARSLAGDFKVSYNGTTRTCADVNEKISNVITVENLGEIAPATSDTAGKTITFTVFAQPQTFNDLKISLNVNVGGSAQTRSLKLTKDGNGVEFAACKKHRLKGVALPGDLWHIYYAPITVDEWTMLDTTDLIVQ